MQTIEVIYARKKRKRNESPNQAHTQQEAITQDMNTWNQG